MAGDAWAVLVGAWVTWRTWPRPRPRPLSTPLATSDHTTSAARSRRARPADRTGRRRQPLRADALAAWCVEVARLVRSGESLAAAAHAVEPPDEPRLVDAIASLQRGERPDIDRPADRDVALVIGVLAGLDAHGGAAAEPLDRAATVLRSRAELLADAATQSAQARWSAQVMTALPVGMLAVLMLTSTSVRAAVLHPAGVLIVAVGGGLNLVGWWWLRALLARPTA